MEETREEMEDVEKVDDARDEEGPSPSDEKATAGAEEPQTVSTEEEKPRMAIVTRGEPGVDYLGTGRRKTATARVRLRRGSGQITINGRKLDVYFPRGEESHVVLAPFEVTETKGLFNARISVRGGGKTGQAGAIRLGIARALCTVDLELRPLLKKEGFLCRDSRMVERKKFGRKGARRSFQFSKR